MSGHPNVVQFLGCQQVQNRDQSQSVLILCELCTQGTIFDQIEKYKMNLSEAQIIFIASHVASGLHHLHSKGVSHRDLKIENVLLHNKAFKLCDFGSAFAPHLQHSKGQGMTVDEAFEEYEKYTTLIYRPPEMCDKFMNWPVTTKVDIWMLGCVIYTMCFAKHPFMEEQSALAIVNSQYQLPDRTNVSPALKDLIRWCMTPDPRERPQIEQVSQVLQ